MSDEQGQGPDSLLPYDAWTQEAMRHVMLRALAYAGAKGLPGEHHFYVTFRTDHPGVVVPDRLRAQYPHEMTIVLQHQFWDLGVDEAAHVISVGLSFGGIATTLRIPFDSVTQFVDPHVRFALRFETAAPAAPAAVAKPPSPQTPTLLSVVPPSEPAVEEEAQVVSLDAFRRRPPARES